MFELDGKIALVTGSSRGLGAAIAKCLAQAGADLVVNYNSDHSAERAERVVQEIRAMGCRAISVQADVSQEKDVIRLVNTAVEQFGRIDILASNAGINSNRNIYDLDLGEWQRIQDTNITGAFLVSKYVVPVMEANGWGRIIFTSSMVAQQGALFGQVHYASTKAALQGFARTLARTVAKKGITVNCVAPGTHMTETLEEILVTSDPHRLDSVIATTPVGHIGTCEDVGYAVCYLASKEAGFVTGAVLDVNGGCYMRS